MRWSRNILIGFGLGLLTLCFAQPALVRAADAPASPAPRAVMEKVTADALAVLRDGQLALDAKREKIKQIAYANINFEVMGRLSLGRYWRDLPDDKKAQYSAEFKEHVTNTYGHTTDDYTNENVTVDGDRRETDGDWTVNTRIVGIKDNKPNQEIAKVEYRFRQQDGQWKIIDFTIDGVSLVANFRSQFQEIMTDGGIDQLLKLLHDKNVANDKQ